MIILWKHDVVDYERGEKGFFYYSISVFYTWVLVRRMEYQKAYSRLQNFKCGSKHRENVFSFVVEEIRALIIESSLAIIQFADNADYGRKRMLDDQNYQN